MDRQLTDEEYESFNRLVTALQRHEERVISGRFDDVEETPEEWALRMKQEFGEAAVAEINKRFLIL